MNKTEVLFDLEKETKNTNKYNERARDGQAPIIGSLYVQKWAKPAKTLKVTVEDAQ